VWGPHVCDSWARLTSISVDRAPLVNCQTSPGARVRVARVGEHHNRRFAAPAGATTGAEFACSRTPQVKWAGLFLSPQLACTTTQRDFGDLNAGAAIAALRNTPWPRPRDQLSTFAVVHRADLYRVWGADSVHRKLIPRRHRGGSSFARAPSLLAPYSADGCLGLSQEAPPDHPERVCGGVKVGGRSRRRRFVVVAAWPPCAVGGASSCASYRKYLPKVNSIV
jgi:hypothetical protein